MAAQTQSGPWRARFVAQITPIKPYGGNDSRRRDGWRPPCGQGQNIRSGEPTLHFYYDGQRMSLLGGLPRGARPFGTTVSIYVYQAIFFGVQQDATQGSVPLQGSTGPSWRRMGFTHYADFSSYVTFAGHQARLAARATSRSQPWIAQLLPDGYQAWSYAPQSFNAGMHGDLNVVLGLIAFSIPANEVARRLPDCFNAGYWVGHDEERGKGWQDYRGLTVQVFSIDSSPDSGLLQQLQSGILGPLFC